MNAGLRSPCLWPSRLVLNGAKHFGGSVTRGLKRAPWTAQKLAVTFYRPQELGFLWAGASLAL